MYILLPRLLFYCLASLLVLTIDSEWNECSFSFEDDLIQKTVDKNIVVSNWIPWDTAITDSSFLEKQVRGKSDLFGEVSS